MDISNTLEPNSDQLDAIELVGGSRIFSIEKVTKGSSEQPVNVHFSDFPRPWRPSKGMRRVLAACWGVDASEWQGRRVELFYDPEVTFGREKPGGTRIKRLSHIDGTKKIPLLVSRGKSATYVVEPLTDATTVHVQTEPSAEEVAACTDPAVLRGWWKTSGAERRAEIEARVAEIAGDGE